MNNNEQMWIVVNLNGFSYDSMEHGLFISSETEAKEYFIKKVKSYIQTEIMEAKEYLSKDISSLKDIVEYTSNKENMTYMYGISQYENGCTFTKYSKVKNKEVEIEEVQVVLQPIQMGVSTFNYGVPYLDNVDEIDNILNSL